MWPVAAEKPLRVQYVSDIQRHPVPDVSLALRRDPQMMRHEF
jgi:hypothetical protein